jgi:hypothetical protein
MADDNDIKDGIVARLRGRYIFTYDGSKDEFDREYLELLQKNMFEPVKYIPLTGKTIVFVNDMADINGAEDKSDLENRLKMLYSERLSVEQVREYKVKG